MVEALSPRAQKIYKILLDATCPPKHEVHRWIRQQTLADKLGCSRRTIGRALNELKAAGLLLDLNQRHQNRCKMYEISPYAKASGDKPLSLVFHAEQQLKLYRSTFEAVFRDWPEWQKFYPQVTHELAHETNMDALFRQTFDKLYAIRAC